MNIRPIHNKDNRPLEWGWTSYTRTGLVRANGRKKYIGYFKTDNDPFNVTTTRITFWANRPVIAMRTIANSGKDPLEFHNQEIN